MSDTIKHEVNNEVRSKKNMKRSTKKLIKLRKKDAYDIPNHDKYGRIV